jgi:hypothetical protein
MRTDTEYRKHAEKCWELANFTTEPTNKEILERLGSESRYFVLAITHNGKVLG